MKLVPDGVGVADIITMVRCDAWGRNAPVAAPSVNPDPEFLCFNPGFDTYHPWKPRQINPLVLNFAISKLELIILFNL